MSRRDTATMPYNRESARRGLAVLLSAVDPLTLPPALRARRFALLRLYARRDEARAEGAKVKPLTDAAIGRLRLCLERCAAAEYRWRAKRARWEEVEVEA